MVSTRYRVVWAVRNSPSEAEFTLSGAQFRAVALTNSLPMTKEMMRAGLGIGFFTPAGFINEPKAGELVHVPLSEPDLALNEIGVLIHRDRQTSPAVRALSARLIDEFASLEKDIEAWKASC